jgi:hypothetical protein
VSEQRTAAGAAIAVLAVLTLAACTSTESGQAAADGGYRAPTNNAGTIVLPPPPQNLSLAGVDPCALLTAAQLTGFAVQPGRSIGTDPLFKSPLCAFRFNTEAAGAEYAIDAVTSAGVNYWLSPTLADTVTKVSVAGFPAVTVTSKNSLATGCETAVGVATGQMLIVNDGVQPHDVTVPQSCARTQQVAAAALTTLLTLK